MSHVSRYLDPALVEQLNQMQLSARSVVEGTTTGLHRSPLKGASIEFRQHRFYVHGDEPRRIDWRVLARTDRPYVKEYDEETNLRCALVLDASGSMAYGGSGQTTKLEYAGRLTAALAYLMLGQTESVGLAVSREGLAQWLAPYAGHSQLSRVVAALERAKPAGRSDVARCMHEVAERLERRSLVVVFSDFFVDARGVREGLAHLRHDGHEVVLVQVVDVDEEEFPFRNWVRLRGLEGEGARVCEPALARQTYRENFVRHRRALEESCAALGAVWQVATTSRGLIETVRHLVARRATGRQ